MLWDGKFSKYLYPAVKPTGYNHDWTSNAILAWTSSPFLSLISYSNNLLAWSISPSFCVNNPSSNIFIKDLPCLVFQLFYMSEYIKCWAIASGHDFFFCAEEKIMVQNLPWDIPFFQVKISKPQILLLGLGAKLTFILYLIS